MAELTRRVLWFMVCSLSPGQKCGLKVDVFQTETDPAVVESEAYLTAHLLLCHYSRGSGNKQIFNISETVRGSIIVNAANAGLFQRSTVYDTINMTLEQRWAQWVVQESRHRLAWEIFISCPVQSNAEEWCR